MIGILKKIFKSKTNGKSVAGFRGEVYAEKDAFSLGEEVIISAEYTNCSGASRTFRGSPVVGNVGNGVVKMHRGGFLRLKAQDGSALEPKSLIFTNPISSCVPRTLKHNERFTARIDISRIFEINAPGEYTFTIGVLVDTDAVIEREVPIRIAHP